MNVAFLYSDRDDPAVDIGDVAVDAQGLANGRNQEQAREPLSLAGKVRVVQKRGWQPKPRGAGHADEAGLAAAQGDGDAVANAESSDHQWRRREPTLRAGVNMVDHFDMHRARCPADAGFQGCNIADPSVHLEVLLT